MLGCIGVTRGPRVPYRGRPVTRGAPPANCFAPLEKCVGHSLILLDIVQTFGPLSEDSSPHLVSWAGYWPVEGCSGAGTTLSHLFHLHVLLLTPSCFALKWVRSCFKMAIFRCVLIPLLLALHPWVILCFEKRRPKRKYCCSPKVKHFGHPKILGWLLHWLDETYKF